MTLTPIDLADPSRYDPEKLRRKIVTGGADEFAQGLIDALKPRIFCDLCRQKSGYNRWAYNLFARTAKLIQADAMVLVAILGKFGVRTEAELHDIVEQGKRFQSLARGDLTLEQYADKAVEVLEVAFKERPSLRSAVLARLGVRMIESEGQDGPSPFAGDTNGKEP